MRGFKDLCKDMETFAGAATRWAQRLVNSVAAQHEDFALSAFDVGSAFANGMTFAELAELTGEPLRAVQFELSAADVALLQCIPGFENFNPHLECLSMIKPIYGLKDAPRAWRKKLHVILTEGGMQQLYADSQLYVAHMPQTTSPQGGAQRVSEPKLTLRCLLSTHVDDLKGAARRSDAEKLLQHIEKHVGKCKQAWNTFLHTGIQHERSKDGIYCHQHEYALQLKPLDPRSWKNLADDELAEAELASLFISLLGGAAWMVLTRPDAAVYIQALQRRAHAPRVVDCKRLNLVVKFIKNQPSGIRYRKLKGTLRLVCFSDSAFRAVPEESSGLALRGCCILLASDDPKTPASPDGGCHLIEFCCRRQRRVQRSTFAAELNGLVDSLEVTVLIQMALHQLLHGCKATAAQLAEALEEGHLSPGLDAVVDARAVFDAVRAADVCDPQECSLKLHRLALRDKLTRRLVRRLYWTDTRDMLGDALTKGGVDRELILTAADEGRYRPQHDVLVCSK